MKVCSFFLLLSLWLTSCQFTTKEKNSIAKENQLNDSVYEITLLFVGDVMQHTMQLNAAKTASGYNYDSYFQYVKKEILQADLSFANLETTLAGEPYSGYPSFNSPKELLFNLHDVGFDVIQIANNHILDKGVWGLKNTLDLLDSLKIQHTGVFRSATDRINRNPLIIDKKNFCIALLNYTYGTNSLTVDSPYIVNYISKEKIEKDIQKAKDKQTDAIIALMHWGEEYQSLPNAEQKELAQWLIHNGVHHIIGSHPHVVQPIHVFTDSITKKQSIIAYSLGNCISNMSKKNTDGGMMLKLKLQKNNQVTTLKSCEYNLIWTGRPIITQEKNFILYPASKKEFNINKIAKTIKNNFLIENRKHLNKHNQGGIEYLLE